MEKQIFDLYIKYETYQPKKLPVTTVLHHFSLAVY